MNKVNKMIDLVKALCCSTRDERREIIKRRISQLGLPLKVQEYGQLTNLLTEVRGKDQTDSVLISAHYDVHPNCGKFGGAYDNLAGVAVSLELLEYFSKKDPDYDLKFAFFDGEESGQKGSLYFLGKLSLQERSRLMLHLNIDGIGVGDRLAEESEFPVAVYITDSLAFKGYGIPSKHYFTLSLEDFDQLKSGILPKLTEKIHTPKDNFSLIEEKSLDMARTGLIDIIENVRRKNGTVRKNI